MQHRDQRRVQPHRHERAEPVEAGDEAPERQEAVDHVDAAAAAPWERRADRPGVHGVVLDLIRQLAEALDRREHLDRSHARKPLGEADVAAEQVRCRRHGAAGGRDGRRGVQDQPDALAALRAAERFEQEHHVGAQPGPARTDLHRVEVGERLRVARDDDGRRLEHAAQLLPRIGIGVAPDALGPEGERRAEPQHLGVRLEPARGVVVLEQEAAALADHGVRLPEAAANPRRPARRDSGRAGAPGTRGRRARCGSRRRARAPRAARRAARRATPR